MYTIEQKSTMLIYKKERLTFLMNKAMNTEEIIEAKQLIDEIANLTFSIAVNSLIDKKK